MNNLNSVLLEGHLTQNPVLKQLESTSLCTFSIGNNRFYKKDDTTVKESSFFQIEFWGKTAENCAKYLHKGSCVRIVGRLKQEQWKDADGNTRYTVKVVGEHADFFPSKKQQTKETKLQKDSDATHAEDTSEVEEIPF